MKEAQEVLRYLCPESEARFLGDEHFPAQVVEILGMWCKVEARRDSWTQWQRYKNGTTSGTRHRLWRG